MIMKLNATIWDDNESTLYGMSLKWLMIWNAL